MEWGGMTPPPQAQPALLDTKLYTMLEVEGARYASFFATLGHTAQQLVPRADAVAFFAKSSLSDHQVQALYELLKSAHVQPDVAGLNETEFVMGMHLIVCMTKRGLATLPPTLPAYLFPTLHLPSPTATHADLISSMPSPEKPSASTTSMGHTTSAGLASFQPHGADGSIQKLQDATTLVELLHKEAHNRQVHAHALAQLDVSEAATLANLHASLEKITDAVEQLGFPVPASARSLGALDDCSNLLRKNVQSVRQEIQSLEIDAQMRSVADEATASSRSGRLGSEAAAADTAPSAAIAAIAELTQQLASLQRDAVALRHKRAELAGKVLAGSAATGESTVAPASESSAVPASTTGGGLSVSDAPTLPVSAAAGSETTASAAAPQEESFGWGAF